MNICWKATIWVRNSQRDTSETTVGDHEPDHNEGMKKEVARKAEHVYGHVRVFNTHAQVEKDMSTWTAKGWLTTLDHLTLSASNSDNELMLVGMSYCMIME